MTCIVGMEYNGNVLIGGDLQGTGWNHKIAHTQPKVFSKKGILFGYTSSYRFGQIIEHSLTDPVTPDDPIEIYRWLITVIVPDIREAIVKYGGGTADKGGTALIGIKGQLWELQEDYSVLRSVDGCMSVGSGSAYALGALAASLDISKPISKDECIAMIKRAIAIANMFCPTVGHDSTVLST